VKRILGIVLLMLFTVGTVVVPVFHAAYGDACEREQLAVNGRSHSNTPAHHDHEKCPICQMAATQMEKAMPLIAPAAVVSLIGDLPVLRISVPHIELLGISQARGPPTKIS